MTIKVTKQPQTSTPKTPSANENTGDALALVKTVKGYVVVRFTFTGLAIDLESRVGQIDVGEVDVLAGPDARPVAAEMMKRALIQHILPPRN